MKIKMKETKKGSPDGVLVFDYQKGKTYDPPESLATAFVRAGWASLVIPQKPPETKIEEPQEKKVIEPDETKEGEEEEQGEIEDEDETKEEAPPEKKDKK